MTVEHLPDIAQADMLTLVQERRHTHLGVLDPFLEWQQGLENGTLTHAVLPEWRAIGATGTTVRSLSHNES